MYIYIYILVEYSNKGLLQRAVCALFDLLNLSKTEILRRNDMNKSVKKIASVS